MHDSNFFEKQWTQYHPQNLSGLSHALFPTTFLEIAVNKKRSTSVTHANNQSMELHYKNKGPLSYSKSKRWSGSNSLSELRISVASKSVGFVFVTLWTQFPSSSLHLQSKERIESRNGLLYRKYKCFRGWFWPILYFLCETLVWHLDSCPPEDTWYGVILWVLRVLGQGLNQSARIFFIRAFSGCYGILTSPKEGKTAVCGYNPVLFWVISVSCWCLAELIFTYYDQHCSTLLVEFNMSIVPGPIHQNNSLLF